MGEKRWMCALKGKNRLLMSGLVGLLCVGAFATVFPPVAAQTYQVLQICYTRPTLSQGSQTCSYRYLFITLNPANTPPETLQACGTYCLQRTSYAWWWPPSYDISSEYFTFCYSNPLLVTGPNWELSILTSIDTLCQLYGP